MKLKFLPLVALKVKFLLMQKASEVLERNKVGIIEEWVRRVREELPAPNQTADLVLRNHLPLLLDDIINIMKRFENMEFTSELSNYNGMLDTSIGHGRHRSSSKGYDVEQILKEYIILHRILTKQLRSSNVFSTEVGDLLKYVIENSMLYAVVAFNGSLQEIQQKMLGIVAHDIRNPVSAAHLGIDMLRQEDSPEQFEKIKEMSKKSIRRSLELLEELLESVFIQAGEGMTLYFSERDLVEYIRSVYGEAKKIYSNEVILKCDEEQIIGVFDTAMVRRVLENIINNAVKYGRRGTPVTISVEDLPGKVVISVHNEGNPIPEKEQKEIFRFSSTSNGSGPKKLRSWGMGLTLVNALAKAHGGYIDLESNKEKGTTFTLVLQKNAVQPGKLKTSLNLA